MGVRLNKSDLCETKHAGTIPQPAHRLDPIMKRIFRSDRGAALVLLAAAIVGLVLANSPIGPWLIGVNHAHLPIPALAIDLSVGHWISDLLLAIFFFIVAAELKYELTKGQLNSPRKALVPAIAAVGGVAVPALLFLLLSGGGDLARGWPIPTATDIAFALGVLALFGRGLPPRLRVFLLALAVLDDLIGIVFIAVIFTTGVDFAALLLAAVAIAAFGVLSRWLDRSRWVGVLLLALALVAWYLVLQSGVHATIAGVGLGLVMVGRHGTAVAHRLQPWSNALIMPVFAFSAALVAIPAGDQIGPVVLALALALPLGKTIGITIGGLIGARISRSATPVVGWDLVAIAMVGGLGFTVALLMNQLAFRDNPIALDQGVLGVLAGSGISLVVGAALIAWRASVHRRRIAAGVEEVEIDEDEDGEPDTPVTKTAVP